MAKEVKMFAGSDADSYFIGVRQSFIKEVAKWSEKLLVSDLISKEKEKFLEVKRSSEIKLNFGDTRQRVVKRSIQGRYSVVVTDVYQFYIPYEGPIDLIQLRPSTFGHDIDIGYIEGQNFMVEVLGDDNGGQEARRKFDEFQKKTERYLDLINTSIRKYNSDLSNDLDVKVEALRAGINDRKSKGDDTGFPAL